MVGIRANNNQQLVAIVKELDRQKANRKDLIVSSQSLQAVPDPERIVIDIPKYGGHTLTGWAHDQMAAKTDIPVRYYQRMLQSKNYDLLAHNINVWLGGSDNKLIRILDGNIRAILSDRYKILDNQDMMYVAMEEFMRVGAEIHRADLTDTHMFIKAVTPRLTENVDVGDPVQAGVIIRNSEVGASKFAVEPFILRLRCKNGLVVSQGYGRVHLGSRRDEGEIDFSDETKELENKAIFSAVKDVIHNTFDEKGFGALIDRLRNATKVIITEPVKAIDNIVSYAKFSDAEKEDILNAFIMEKDNTQWGAVNAITAVARDIENPEHQVDMEAKASDIALMDGDDFLDLISQEPRRTIHSKKAAGANGERQGQ